jgi:hypothetical protein
VFAAGLIVKDVPRRVSNFRATASLPEYLEREGTVAIAGVDTRRLTRVLRRTGAQNGCIVGFEPGTEVGPAHIAEAVARAQAAPSMAGLDLAKVVSTTERYEWTETEWQLGQGVGRLESPRFHVVAYDFGVKRNILRMLVDRGCRITVVPAQTPAADVLALKPDGVFLANGPGDPEPCTYAIEAAREFLARKLPLFGMTDLPPDAPLGQRLLDVARHMVLPVVCQTYVSLAYDTRFIRATMAEAMRQDYIRTARAKGAGPWRVLFRHAFRNTLIPLVTLLGLSLPSLVGGSLAIASPSLVAGPCSGRRSNGVPSTGANSPVGMLVASTGR